MNKPKFLIMLLLSALTLGFGIWLLWAPLNLPGMNHHVPDMEMFHVNAIQYINGIPVVTIIADTVTGDIRSASIYATNCTISGDSWGRGGARTLIYRGAVHKITAIGKVWVMEKSGIRIDSDYATVDVLHRQIALYNHASATFF